MSDERYEIEALQAEVGRLRRIISALMHGYTSICEANIQTGEVKLVQFGSSAFSRMGFSGESPTWDALAKHYIEHGVYVDDRLKVRRLLNRDYLREHLNYGEGITCEYRNELSVYGEIRIVRIDDETVLFGFTEKNAEITERIGKLYTDSLTQVKNRKYYDEQLAGRMCQAFVIADLDHFKEVNDTYGHICGDAALTAAAAALHASVRDGDDVIRYGGDEFLVVFRHIAEEALPGRLEAMRRSVERIRLEEYPEVRLTMSFGAVHGHEQVKTMLAAADALLYESKQRRNMFTIREFPHRSGKQEQSGVLLSDEELDMVSGGVGVAGAALTEWAGYRVSHSPRWCPYCNQQTDGYLFTAECESEGVRAALYWCHECKRPYAVQV